MKAFEKWWNSWGKCPKDTEHNHRKLLAREGFREALEHILKNCVLPSGRISRALIEKELEDK